MAINLNRQFMDNMGLNEHNCLSNLVKSLSPDMENETDIFNHSEYYNDSDFRTMVQEVKSDWLPA